MKQERVVKTARVVEYYLKPAGYFLNSRLPALLYKKPLLLPRQKNRAADIASDILNGNGRSNSWRNGIYDFHHYHSVTHECMAICQGWADLILGGPGGKKIRVEEGDVLVLPAGTGHKSRAHSDDFYCVGAYPGGKDFDMNFGLPTELSQARKNIFSLPLPAYEPVFGVTGPLSEIWKKSSRK